VNIVFVQERLECVSARQPVVFSVFLSSQTKVGIPGMPVRSSRQANTETPSTAASRPTGQGDLRGTAALDLVVSLH